MLIKPSHPQQALPIRPSSILPTYGHRIQSLTHLLAQLRHRLIAVQLSDRIRDFVDHVIPGEGFIY